MGLIVMASLFAACNGSKQEKEASHSAITEPSEVSAKLEKGQVRHTVMFSLKHGVDAPETKKFLQSADRILSGLPMVKNFEICRQVSPKNDYAFYLSMVFDDQEAFDAYDSHPEHVKFVKELWETDVADFLEADFVAVD